MSGSLIGGPLAAATEAGVPLPGRLADPLHFPTPPSCAWLVVWLLLIAGLLVWLLRLAWRRWRARRRPAPAPRPSPPPPPGDIAAAIAAIRRRTLETRSYRQGCHELSGTLRAHWEARPPAAGGARPRLTRMTAAEIGRRLGDGAVSRFLTLLAQLQFGRRPPSRNDFVGACNLAREVVSAGKGR